MTSFGDPLPNPETPWEFYPDDDLREEPGMAAEDAAMHIEVLQREPELTEPEVPTIVHYMEDEEPEIPDISVAAASDDSTPKVQDLLIKQHYMSPKDTDFQ